MVIMLYYDAEKERLMGRNNRKSLDNSLIKDLKQKNIDIELTLLILERFNSGYYDRFRTVKSKEIPDINSPEIIDMRGEVSLSITQAEAQKRLDFPGLKLDLSDFCTSKNGRFNFDTKGLKTLGIRLYPYTAMGVLNGGSASSYADKKKNKSFNPELFTIMEENYNDVSEMSRGRPKGIVPAFIQPDGSPGPSFMELKMLSLLSEIRKYQEITGDNESKNILAPFFQMTSRFTNDKLEEAYTAFRSGPLLKGLINSTGIDITEAESGVQPLIAAFTPGEHTPEGKRKDIFTNGWGKKNSTLPLPGGHGQNFLVLKEIYKSLYARGKRFAYLGNVDNLGYTIDPAALAYLALSGKPAGFDFSFKTPVDIKGGILVRDQDGTLTCADIGPAIDYNEVEDAEKRGKPIFFNCATGLFNIEYLVEHIDRIIDGLPMRFSDQDKDAGRYSQAEQVTWEVLGMIPDPAIFAIDKYNRFLPAKLLMDTLMMSGLHLETPGYPSSSDPAKDLKGIARLLWEGLNRKLGKAYGMELKGNRWRVRGGEI
jgi:UTP--glucose-1-phosphate uridylyltransferase